MKGCRSYCARCGRGPFALTRTGKVWRHACIVPAQSSPPKPPSPGPAPRQFPVTPTVRTRHGRMPVQPVPLAAWITLAPIVLALLRGCL